MSPSCTASSLLTANGKCTNTTQIEISLHNWWRQCSTRRASGLQGANDLFKSPPHRAMLTACFNNLSLRCRHCIVETWWATRWCKSQVQGCACSLPRQGPCRTSGCPLKACRSMLHQLALLRSCPALPCPALPCMSRSAVTHSCSVQLPASAFEYAKQLCCLKSVDRRHSKSVVLLVQLLVATGQGNVAYLEIESGKLKQVAHHKLDTEVACLDITPVGQIPCTPLIYFGLMTCSCLCNQLW